MRLARDQLEAVDPNYRMPFVTLLGMFNLAVQESKTAKTVPSVMVKSSEQNWPRRAWGEAALHCLRSAFASHVRGWRNNVPTHFPARRTPIRPGY